MSYSGSVRFSVVGNRVFTHGVDFSGKIAVVARLKKGIEVWHKRAGKVWGGRWMPQAYVPAAFWIVRANRRKKEHEFTIVQEEEPGKEWRGCKERMVKRAMELVAQEAS